MSRKNLVITRENGFLRVVLPDAIGMDDSVEIENKIQESISEKKESLILDFSKTTVIYSSGLGLLIRLQNLIREIECIIYFVNVSRKLQDMFASLNLEKVFEIYATDVEFDLSKDEIWQKKLSKEDTQFIFIAQIEDGIYRLTLSGQMISINDLSTLSEFEPEDEIVCMVLNLQSLDFVDTYGAQLFNDFIERIQNSGKKCIIFGANDMICHLFNIFPSNFGFNSYDTEKEALASIEK